MPNSKKRLLDLLLRSERELDTLFTGLAEQIATEVTRASLFQPVGPSLPSLDGSPPIALEQAGPLLDRCRTLITRTFIGTASNGVPAPYEIKQGAVVPLSPYMRILWPLLLAAGTQAIENQRSILRKRLKNYPDILAAYEPIWERKIAGIIREQDDGILKPLATYDPPHLWVSPDGYRLSDRIWRTEEEMRRKLDLYLKDAINSGKGSLTIAREVVQFLKPGQELPISNKPYGKNVSYNAMRLARTELSAAFNRADHAAMQYNSAVDQYEVLLSNSHPEYDICDEMVANGPYDKTDTTGIPPFHPNCLCTIVAKSTQDVRKLIEKLRDEIAAEFPDMVIAKPDGTFSLQLAGVKLPQVSTVTLVPKLGGTTVSVKAPVGPTPTPPPVPPPTPQKIYWYQLGNEFEPDELQKLYDQVSQTWPATTDAQITYKEQVLQALKDLPLLDPGTVRSTLAFDPDTNQLIGLVLTQYQDKVVYLRHFGVLDETLPVTLKLLKDAAVHGLIEQSPLVVKATPFTEHIFKQYGFFSTKGTTLYSIHPNAIDQFIKTGHAGAQYTDEALAASPLAGKAISEPKPVLPTPRTDPYIVKSGGDLADNDIAQWISTIKSTSKESIFEKKPSDQAIKGLQGIPNDAQYNRVTRVIIDSRDNKLVGLITVRPTVLGTGNVAYFYTHDLSDDMIVRKLLQEAASLGIKNGWDEITFNAWNMQLQDLFTRYGLTPLKVGNGYSLTASKFKDYAEGKLTIFVPYAPGRAPSNLSEIIAKLEEKEKITLPLRIAETSPVHSIRASRRLSEAFNSEYQALKIKGKTTTLKFSDSILGTAGQELEKDILIGYVKDAANLHKDPVVLLRTADNNFYVVDGHHRLAALKALGAREFNAYVVNYEDMLAKLPSPRYDALRSEIEFGLEQAEKILDDPIDEVFNQFGESEGRRVLKRRIMETLAETLRDDEDFLRLVDILVPDRYTGFEYSTQRDRVEEAVAMLVQRWAITSGDDDNLSIAIQMAIKKEFGLKTQLSYWKSAQEKAEKEFGNFMSGLRKFVRAQYEHTQAYFKEQGVKRVFLWRGMEHIPTRLLGYDNIRDVPDFLEVTMQFNPASSYSSRWRVSASFTRANTVPNSDVVHVMVGEFIDVEDILATPLFGMGCSNEYEAVVLGRRKRDVMVYVPRHFDYRKSSTYFFEALRRWLIDQEY